MPHFKLLFMLKFKFWLKTKTKNGEICRTIHIGRNLGCASSMGASGGNKPLRPSGECMLAFRTPSSTRYSHGRDNDDERQGCSLSPSSRDCEITGIAVSRTASQTSSRDVTASAVVTEATHSVGPACRSVPTILPWEWGGGTGRRGTASLNGIVIRVGLFPELVRRDVAPPFRGAAE